MTEEMDIIDFLTTAIQSGKYESDDKLPSENELADRFKVPRITARKAYERLQELGYIYSQQGKGSFVRDRNLRIPLVLSGNVSFSQKMVDLGYSYQSKNIFCEPILFNNKIYETLQADEHDIVYQIGRLRIVNGQPIAIHISYVRAAMFPDIRYEGKDVTSMFHYYKSKGYRDFQSKQTILSVTFPSKFERNLLACSSLIPLLVLESGCMDGKTGHTLECSKIMYRGDCFSYEI
ncbi:transcriptional regulator [Paenibacillus pectinilyticus]|uniref:Transcriptional regulator n=1 Tax=Paenibacillus pectinilyticus TaxID=512399 RepID=A0A1C0ZVW7_9BACL|nr:GntR family transcriptional regulator [Paenibacillus pectinilyticus]OCT12239.1 transcriptional regulator [Paenibacillus pectinilyticus]